MIELALFSATDIIACSMCYFVLQAVIAVVKYVLLVLQAAIAVVEDCE